MGHIGFFDIETKRLFEDVDPHYQTYSWSQKELLRCKLTPKLGMACACVLSDSGEKYEYEEAEEKALLEKLGSFDMVVGHNIVDFDYLVLQPHDALNVLQKIGKKTLDFFQTIKRRTRQYASLNDLAKLNLGLAKTEDGKLVPKMWAAGEMQRVKDYCHNDVKLLKELYEFGLTERKIKYYVKDYGSIVGIRELNDPW
ncbi:MAG: hypothetical protein V1676_03605 [Candidatus Diapherotrites archaeon]